MKGRMQGSGLDSKPILNTFKFQSMHFDIPSMHLTSVFVPCVSSQGTSTGAIELHLKVSTGVG